MKKNIQICARCTYDETVPQITFNANGVCNYCHVHDDLERQFPTGRDGEKALEKMAEEIKKTGKGKKYNCVVGVSGGCDSSYLLVRMVELGLRPLAVHFDNTWNSPIATQNIYKVIERLQVDLHTVVVNNTEFDDLWRSFMLAGVRDLEAPYDLALASVLYAAAEKYGIKYIVEGHSFRTEGISPLGWNYMDGRYIASVHRKFGRVPMKTFPNMSLLQFIRWTVVRGIRRVRPLYYMNYQKDDVKKRLATEFGWEWYGGHHLENRTAAFWHLYVLPRRWNSDLRHLGHAALVRSGQLSRAEALDILSHPAEVPNDLLQLVDKRLGFTDGERERIMGLPRQSWQDFPNYKKSFERLRPLFGYLVKKGRVPHSFYMKFCFPSQMGESEKP
jgi:N-acetyl sugar amidotransferase